MASPLSTRIHTITFVTLKQVKRVVPKPEYTPMIRNSTVRTHYLHELPFLGREKVLEVDPGFDFYQADRVLRLQIEFSEENPTLNLSLLARDRHATHYTLELQFEGIRELVLPEMRPLLFLPELEFEDVSDRMLEGIRYEAISHYERAFRCTCQSIVISAFERCAE